LEKKIKTALKNKDMIYSSEQSTEMLEDTINSDKVEQNTVDFEKEQLKQAIETYRNQFSLLTQIITILIIADSTIIGYAMNTKFVVCFYSAAYFP
jgi:hypothetical protein